MTSRRASALQADANPHKIADVHLLLAERYPEGTESCSSYGANGTVFEGSAERAAERTGTTIG
jgi:hypothetical protein